MQDNAQQSDRVVPIIFPEHLLRELGQDPCGVVQRVPGASRATRQTQALMNPRRQSETTIGANVHAGQTQAEWRTCAHLSNVLRQVRAALLPSHPVICETLIDIRWVNWFPVTSSDYSYCTPRGCAVPAAEGEVVR